MTHGDLATCYKIKGKISLYFTVKYPVSERTVILLTKAYSAEDVRIGVRLYKLVKLIATKYSKHYIRIFKEDLSCDVAKKEML